MKEIIIASIMAFPPTLMALLAWSETRKVKIQNTNLHLMINSRMDELLKASKAESRAEGVEEGRAENK